MYFSVWHGNAYFFAIIFVIQVVFICFNMVAFIESVYNVCQGQAHHFTSSVVVLLLMSQPVLYAVVNVEVNMHGLSISVVDVEV